MKVYLVEDSAVIRERLRDMIKDLDPRGTILEAASRSTAIAGIRRRNPDLVLLDLTLEDGSGLDVLRDVREISPATKVIVFTNQATQPYRNKCMALGATGFFDKSQEFEQLRSMVRQIGSH